MKCDYCLGSSFLARRLIDAGIPVGPEQDAGDELCTTCPGLLISSVPGPFLTFAFDLLECGGVGYVLDLFITVARPGQFVICEWQLEPPWEDTQLWWLPDPAEQVPAQQEYRICGRNKQEFSRELVINHRLGPRRKFRRGDVIEGLLLGTSTSAIPDVYRHGESVNAKLSFFDQFGRTFSSSISLWLDRSARTNPRRRVKERRRLLETPCEVAPPADNRRGSSPCPGSIDDLALEAIKCEM